ncbi:MAG: DUF3467 domain-containing protein [Deltaproteobacteria bacterium]|nr:DUF3467 domain-containing protein [Deltaproteobacteria bacterium]
MAHDDQTKGGPGQPQLQLQIDDGTAQGIYSNLAMIYHSENEFVLDFAYIQPGPQPARAKVRARIILSPKHVLRLLQAVQTNVDKFEERFGPISPASDEHPVFH